jgi:hypothetical protein
MFLFSQRAAILGQVPEPNGGIMNDLQAKFAMTLVVVGLFFACAVPMMKQAKFDHDSIAQRVGEVYVAPNPDDPNAPHGNVSVDDLQKYKDQKSAEERKALGLQ